MSIQSSPIVLGCRVAVELVSTTGEVERHDFTIVADKQADFKAGLLGESALIGRTLLGRRAGETVPYQVGDLKEVRILAVEAGTGPPSSDIADQRRAAVQEAANQSEIISQMIFATTSGSKWGDYDVDIDKLMNQEKPK